MVCKNCKTHLDKHAVNCPNCGALSPYGIYLQKEEEKYAKFSAKSARKNQRQHYKHSFEYKIKKQRIFTFICLPIYLLELIFILVISLSAPVRETLFPSDFSIESIIVSAFAFAGWIAIYIYEIMFQYHSKFFENIRNYADPYDGIRHYSVTEVFNIIFRILFVILTPITFPFIAIIWLVRHRFD